MDNLDQYLKEWIQYPGLRAVEIKLMKDAFDKITLTVAEEVKAEKGDRQILDVIKDAKEARDKKWKGGDGNGE